MPAVLVPAGEGRPIVIDKAVIFIGRHPDCDVVLNKSRKISRKHCCLAQVDDRVVVRDLGSMNGISLNGRRVSGTAALSIGDELTIGDVPFVVRFQPVTPRRPLNAVAVAAVPIPSPRPPIVAAPVDISQNFPVPIPEEPSPLADGMRIEKLPGSDFLPDDDEPSDDVIPILDDEES